MSLTLEQLEAAALALPEHEREYLLQRLIASLDREDGLGDPEEVERAWIAEIRRRQDRVRSGESHEVPAEEVLGRLQARVRSA